MNFNKIHLFSVTYPFLIKSKFRNSLQSLCSNTSSSMFTSLLVRSNPEKEELKKLESTNFRKLQGSGDDDHFMFVTKSKDSIISFSCLIKNIRKSRIFTFRFVRARICLNIFCMM